MKIGILGGAGYTAGELIRILINHPEAEISFVNSESNATFSFFASGLVTLLAIGLRNAP